MTAVSGYGDCNGFGRIWVEDGQASNFVNCPGCDVCRRVSAKLGEITRGGGDQHTPAPDALAARIDVVTAERDAALRECVKLAREAGEARGKLETSEAVGIVDGWREKCERYEVALTEIARLRTELRGDFSMGSRQSDIARKALGTEGRNGASAAIGDLERLEREFGGSVLKG